MKLQLCALKDAALDTYQRPFYAQTTAHAVRMFTDLMQDTQSEPSKHPEDFTLYHLGEWDDTNGETKNNGAPKMLLRGRDAKVKGGNGAS